MGFGLRTFSPSVRCKPLAAGTSRVLRNLRTGADSKEARSWVKDIDGKLQLELRREQSDTIHLCSDQGSVGFQASQWLRSGLALRCTNTYDPLHRCYNDFRGSVAAAGLTVSLLEWKLALLCATWAFSATADTECHDSNCQRVL